MAHFDACAFASLWGQGCPSDANCYNQGTNCAGCLGFTACNFCTDSGQCEPGELGPIPNSNCAHWILSGNSCQAPSPAGSPTNAYPQAGTLALVFLVLISIILGMRVLLYIFSIKWKPILGSRLQPAGAGPVQSHRDFSRGWLLYAPLVLVVLSLLFKLLSMGLDRWDQYYTPASDDPLNPAPSNWAYWGLLRLRIVVPDAPESSTDTSYLSLCQQYQSQNDPNMPDPDQANNLGMCYTLRAAGVMCLLTGVLSVVFSTPLLIFCVGFVSRRTSLGYNGIRAWRCAGFAHAFSLCCFGFWILSAHGVIHHLQDGGVHVGPSYALMLVGWIFDLALLIFVRRAISWTQNPEITEGGVGGTQSYGVLSASGGGDDGQFPLPTYPDAPAGYQAGYHQAKEIP